VNSHRLTKLVTIIAIILLSFSTSIAKHPVKIQFYNNSDETLDIFLSIDSINKKLYNNDLADALKNNRLVVIGKNSEEELGESDMFPPQGRSEVFNYNDPDKGREHIRFVARIKGALDKYKSDTNISNKDIGKKMYKSIGTKRGKVDGHVCNIKRQHSFVIIEYNGKDDKVYVRKLKQGIIPGADSVTRNEEDETCEYDITNSSQINDYQLANKKPKFSKENKKDYLSFNSSDNDLEEEDKIWSAGAPVKLELKQSNKQSNDLKESTD